jgi:hypothetical protein
MLLFQSTSHDSQVLFPSPRQDAFPAELCPANIGVVAHVLAAAITGYVVLDIGQHGIRAMLGNEGCDGDQAVAVAAGTFNFQLIRLYVS